MLQQQIPRQGAFGLGRECFLRCGAAEGGCVEDSSACAHGGDGGGRPFRLILRLMGMIVISREVYRGLLNDPTDTSL